MKLTSEAFDQNERIPDRYTCHGEDVSPPLSIEGVDPKAQSLALIVDDPDAPMGVFDHWLIWNIPAETERIPAGIAQEERPSELEGTFQGENDFNELGYRGPCPPGGSEHVYRFTLFALEEKLDLKPGAGKGALREAMEGKVIERSLLRGSYSI